MNLPAPATPAPPGPRRRGRPRGRKEEVIVAVRIPAAIYDAYCRASREKAVSIHRLMVTILTSADPQRF